MNAKKRTEPGFKCKLKYYAQSLANYNETQVERNKEKPVQSFNLYIPRSLIQLGILLQQ